MQVSMILGIKSASLFTDAFKLPFTMSQKKSDFKDESCEKIENFIHCEKDELDLGITLKGGQSFRWVECNDGYRGVFHNTVWTLVQRDNKIFYTIHGSLKNDLNYGEILSKYFRLDVSLKENIQKWADCDSHFKTAYDQVGPVRMLDQDIVENLFSFICSSNNNITRISGMVEKLCRIFGDKICELENQTFFDFPKIENLTSSDVESTLRKEGFGYRAGYIIKSAKKLKELGGRMWLQGLMKENGVTYEHARENLMLLPGIGPKVADCICLMSLGHLEAIPVDTHIFQVACANYTPHLSKQTAVTPKIHQEINVYLRNLWGPLAGWAQTIVFCAKITSADKRKNKKRSAKENVQKSCQTKRTRKKT
ncbi:N-glycosylase/DNA lyase [Trichogramma pretiosum]|uniref:N-glycosylase/DNA lyase n=1 Tax=Trichogramma pretiosum TaxID=7493 RepID=UPI0006C98B76|nr:N-glycosylase/DNA lyase [Trichogramma pretiosum]